MCIWPCTVDESWPCPCNEWKAYDDSPLRPAMSSLVKELKALLWGDDELLHDGELDHCIEHLNQKLAGRGDRSRTYRHGPRWRLPNDGEQFRDCGYPSDLIVLISDPFQSRRRRMPAHQRSMSVP